MNDLSVADCPACLRISKHRIPQVFSAIDRSPKTLGALADLNRGKMSDASYGEKMQKMANERKQLSEYKGFIPEGASLVEKKSVERPFFRPDRDTPDVGLAKMTPEQTTRYVFEGKRPIGV